MKRIIRYVKDTTSLGLFYSRDDSFTLTTYCDGNFGGCRTDIKNTSEPCFLLGNSLVAWSCKNQNSITLSTTEAKYMTTFSGCAYILWMKQSLYDYDIKIGVIPLKCDNKSIIYLFYTRTKHIDVKHHFLKEHTEKKNFCPHRKSNDKYSNKFLGFSTKSLGTLVFVLLEILFSKQNNSRTTTQFTNKFVPLNKFCNSEIYF